MARIQTLRKLLSAALMVPMLGALPSAAQPLNENLKITAPDGADSDQLGFSVAVSGTVAIFGAIGDDDGGAGSGSAYLFDTMTGTQLAKLTASDADGGDTFGISMDISGTFAIVGAPYNQDQGPNTGSAYLYDFSDLNDIKETKLTASDANEFDEYGISVAVSDNIALVSAHRDDDGGINTGSVYLYDVHTGAQLAKLNASDAEILDEFGRSVAISGTTAIIGAAGNNDAGSDSGSAYLFDLSDLNDIKETKITASDASEWKEFGRSVAISGTAAIVGARDNSDGNGTGTAYLFDFSDLNDIKEINLTASDAGEDDIYGYSVGISGTTAIVGAYRDDDSFNDSGSAYLYDFSDPGDIKETKLVASDAEERNYFGRSVGISGATAVVGAYWNDTVAHVAGAGYVFGPSACVVDLNNDGTLDFFDLSAFITAFNNRYPVADFNRDGTYDFFDVAAFIVAFGRGCP